MDLGLEVVRNLSSVAAERDLGVVLRIVGVAGREVSPRGLALNAHVVLVVVYLEAGFGGVYDFPDDDRGDLDRISVKVVDLELLALEVAHPERNPALGVERIGPAETRVLRGIGVVAEELKDP